MGFFSLPLARMVGPDGRVLCVDLQEKMLDGLRTRASRAGLSDRIEAIACPESDLGIGRWLGQVDLAVVIYMLHEVPDGPGLLRQIYAALKPGGRLLIVEPKGHVSPAQFESARDAARAAGFVECAATVPGKRLAVMLEKPGARG
jgi:ubiquinone/menaquinone biosynthesis C-methylase UbiE